MSRPVRVAVLLVALAAVLVGCGRDAPTVQTVTGNGKTLGFPGVATKNTTRIGGADPTADAAAIARAVFPETSPHAVVLADDRDWRVGLAASVLMSRPIGAPLLYAHGDGDLPSVTKDAIDALRPTGARQAGGAQVIRVGDVPAVDGQRTTDVRGKDPFALARAVDALQAAARGATSDQVLVVSADAPAYAMPAAAWAAKSGDPVLFTHRDDVPADTRAAIAAHQQPRIYVLGPASVISDRALSTLRRLGTVTRIAGSSPVANAIAFARFLDGSFGWGVVDPGHGLVFATTSRPEDAAAAAPLSASGTYGPLLLVDDAAHLPPELQAYLLDVQPGYTRDPVRGVYNHGWIVGDQGAMSVAAQSHLDSLLEIVPVNERPSGAPSP